MSPHTSRGRDFIVVALPNGRHRSLHRNQTDLVAPLAKAEELYSQLPVDVPVLLTLMRHLSGRLSRPAKEVIRDEEDIAVSGRKNPVTNSVPGTCAACVAKTDPGDREATRPHGCEACATKAAARKSAGRLPC